MSRARTTYHGKKSGAKETEHEQQTKKYNAESAGSKKKHTSRSKYQNKHDYIWRARVDLLTYGLAILYNSRDTMYGKVS